MASPGWWNKLITPPEDTRPIDLQDPLRKREVLRSEYQAQADATSKVLRVSGRHLEHRTLPALIERRSK